MKELVTRCDACSQHNPEDDISTIKIAFDDEKPLTLDLCQQHHDQYVSGLMRLLHEHGAPTQSLAHAPKKETKPAEALVVCPVCPERRTGVNGLALHIAKAHNYDLGPSPAIAYYGSTCPVCNQGDIKVLGHHSYFSHPDLGSGIAGLWEAAANLGDPYGVIASNRERLTRLINGKGVSHGNDS